MKKVAVLYSGGLDSLVTAHLYYHLGYDITLIHYNYGQIANTAEYIYTKKYSEYINAKLKVIDITNIFDAFKEHSRLLNNDKERDSVLEEAESDSNYVPMRNLILLSYAAAHCEILDIDRLAYGANLTESGNYPDNSLRFYLNLRQTLKTSGKQNFKLILDAPLINFTKKEIIAIAKYINAPIELSISCYYPIKENNTYHHCNNCGSCLLRLNAIERAKNLSDKQIEIIYTEVLKQMNKLT